MFSNLSRPCRKIGTYILDKDYQQNGTALLEPKVSLLNEWWIAANGEKSRTAKESWFQGPEACSGLGIAKSLSDESSTVVADKLSRAKWPKIKICRSLLHFLLWLQWCLSYDMFLGWNLPWLPSAQAAKKELLDLKTRGEQKYREVRRWSETSWTQQARRNKSCLCTVQRCSKMFIQTWNQMEVKLEMENDEPTGALFGNRGMGS